MHIWTHLKKESEGKTGLGIYPDGMVEHDGDVGQLLDKLKELGLEDNTIVMYSTDNGAEVFSGPMAARRRSAARRTPIGKAAIRVPLPIRWPGVIKPGTIVNDIVRARGHVAHAAGRGRRARFKEQLLKGMKVGNKTFKVHLDGYNSLTPSPAKRQDPRHEFFYFNDDGSLVALRYDHGSSSSSSSERMAWMFGRTRSSTLRVPKFFNLRSDPFETADQVGMDYGHWRVERVFLLVPAQQYVGQFLATFKEYPQPESRQFLARPGAAIAPVPADGR